MSDMFGRLPGATGDDDRYFPVSSTTETLAQLSAPLNVHVDIVDLLDHYQGDEAAMFEMLGKLKDLFG